MPTFTIELRTLIEEGEDVGLAEYPIFDEAYRATLNRKIVEHYWFDEIGHETPQIFRHQLKVRMQEIMPYYNQLYESERLKFDPFLTMDMSSDSDSSSSQSSNREAANDGEQSGRGASTSRSVNSEFPQTMLSGNEDYATNAADVNAVNDTSSLSKGKSAESATGDTSGRSRTATKGYNGSRSALLSQFRSTFINIDTMIISDLANLFMEVWNVGDSYSQFSRPSMGY